MMTRLGSSKPWIVSAFVWAASNVAAQTGLDTHKLARRMSAARTFPSSFTGTATVTESHVGEPSPDLKDPVEAIASHEGTYRWYVQGSDWWMVKNVPEVSPAVGPIMDFYVIRNYEDRVLSYTDASTQSGQSYFADAHLDSKQTQAPLGPMCGRLWNKGPIEEMLERMTGVRQTRSARGIEIDGLIKNEPLHLSVDPQRDYLVTSLDLHPNKGRFGFEVSKTRQIDGVWFPEEVDLHEGHYERGRLTKGFEGHIHFDGFASHGRPSKSEVPRIPPGAVLGGDDNRLYRVANDGTLVDFGRAGSTPGTSLGWGNMFVFSGAGLLLGSLSWLVFRKRRSSPPSPSRR